MKNIIAPPAHASGARVPQFNSRELPKHIAIVMDGNGRWANERGLPRTEGHKAGELALMEVLAGAIEAGISVVSVYAFSTENWKRSPQEVNFLMGYSRDIISKRRAELNSWGVKIIWSGREPRIWKSTLKELNTAEELTKGNTKLILNFCFNYGGRAELVDAMRAVGEKVKAGKLNPQRISEKTISTNLYKPTLPDVDLFIRSGGEQRISNFLLWQSSYAELLFVPEAWPDFDRLVLWRCISSYANRERRFGTAIDKMAGVEE